MNSYKTLWDPQEYPHTRRSDHVDIYKSEKHGEVKVTDPYNWLEKHGAETDAWTTAQAEFTRKFLDQNPHRNDLEHQLRENFDYEKFSRPVLKKDGHWYWSYNSGLQAQFVYYRSKDATLPLVSSQSGPEQGADIYFDQNLITDDGTGALATTAFSECGQYFAYGISLSGSDFCTIYIRRTTAPFVDKTQRELSSDPGRFSDELRFVKFSSIVWTKDSKGFFYQRMPARSSHGEAGEDKAGTETDKDENAMLMYHSVGTAQSEDILVLKDAEHPHWMWGPQVTLDGKYLAVYISKDTSRKHLLWITDLTKNEIGQNMKWTKVIDEFDASYNVIGNDDSKFYFMSNKDAPRYKVITIDISDANLTRNELVPEDKEAKLESANLVNEDAFVLVYKRNVKDELYLHDLSGKRLKRLAADFVGKIEISSRRDQSWFFATLSGFTTPCTLARYDFKEPKEEVRWSVYRTTKLEGLNPDDFSAEQVWYNSTDGTRIPMFIVRHKSTPKDGTAPAIQYGYGGFTISINPFFSVVFLTFLQRFHAVLAVPNIRGGGEFGEEWHLAGTKERKMNVFNDFISATQYLKNTQIAAPDKISINGGSNGGLLVAACVNIAAEGTFGAAVAEVGVLDMLKFNKFTIGRAWTSDYGNPDDPHDFDFIYPYSPLHNVPKNTTLPPTILLTADHDDRVVPLHSFKHAAALQYTLPKNPNPLLIRIEKKAGHGAGKSTEQRIKEAADKLGFIAQTLGLKWYEE
ncbi:prolyl oligopeptidase [Fomitiporia mediterranea MF3/22]|uniref:prolyl oligopeptidase n=1 Tax=Fomitiporia mediterranea (strain MF3/22) TaxID=694068 RepID=UPI00044072F5|nr:prolyl oligopeptidase [Fomitiporia mediterranea MF3/22]EJD00885.1 prolyl oligopeptidase [Fomitiporia mediterranea MF3/22]